MREAKDEGGAVTLVVALTMTVLMGIASFALDLGLQRVGIRDMQALSDVVALDMARHLDGRTSGVIRADTEWGASLGRSVASNSDTFGDRPRVAYELGTMDEVTHAFSEVASDVAPDAVRITSSSSVDYVLRTGEGAVQRAAVARAGSNACFMLGSYAARVKAGDSSLLGPILGAVDADLDLGLVDYQGLAVADVKLGDIAADLGVGSVDELAAATVSVGDFYAAVASALRKEGDAAAATLLDSLALKVTGLPDINVGDVVGLSTAGDAALSSYFNALDLVTAAAFVADGEHAVNVPSLGVTIPGVTNLNGSLSVIEAPQYACGVVNETTVHTAQVGLEVGGTLASLPSVLGLAATSAGLDLDASVASAEGTLRDISCGNPTNVNDPEGIDVDVRTGLTDISLGVPIRLQGDLNILGLGNVRLDIQLRAGASVTSADNTESVEYRVPPLQYGDAKETVNGGLGLPGATVTIQSVSAKLVVLGIVGADVTLPADTLDSIVAEVTTSIVNPIVNPLIGNVNNLLLGPVSDALGLRLGGADLYMMKSPTCTSPGLVG
jgi:uncharacterized membrane protein